jgi:hypothetical protein
MSVHTIPLYTVEAYLSKHGGIGEMYRKAMSTVLMKANDRVKVPLNRVTIKSNAMKDCAMKDYVKAKKHYITGRVEGRKWFHGVLEVIEMVLVDEMEGDLNVRVAPTDPNLKFTFSVAKVETIRYHKEDMKLEEFKRIATEEWRLNEDFGIEQLPTVVAKVSRRMHRDLSEKEINTVASLRHDLKDVDENLQATKKRKRVPPGVRKSPPVPVKKQISDRDLLCKYIRDCEDQNVEAVVEWLNQARPEWRDCASREQ